MALLAGRISMSPFFVWSMRRAPAILFGLSLTVLTIGVIVAIMTSLLTSAQVSHAPLSSVTIGGYGVARLQLFSGLMAALQSASWPFAAGALVHAFQSREKL
jgi:hypothetical protein